MTMGWAIFIGVMCLIAILGTILTIYVRIQVFKYMVECARDIWEEER